MALFQTIVYIVVHIVINSRALRHNYGDGFCESPRRGDRIPVNGNGKTKKTDESSKRGKFVIFLIILVPFKPFANKPRSSVNMVPVALLSVDVTAKCAKYTSCLLSNLHITT